MAQMRMALMRMALIRLARTELTRRPIVTAMAMTAVTIRIAARHMRSSLVITCSDAGRRSSADSLPNTVSMAAR
jgi:hypothetical protein